MVTERRLTTMVLVIGLGMLLGRFTGLAREMALAARFGLSWQADMAMLAISLPDLLNAILIGGAVGAVLIPEFHRLRVNEGEAAAGEMAAQFLMIIGLMSVTCSLLVALFADVVIRILAPGLPGSVFVQGMSVVRVAAWALPACAVGAVISAILQSREKVLSPALGTLVFNLILIAAILAYPAAGDTAWLSVAVLVAAGVRLSTQVVELGTCRHIFSFGRDWFRFRRLRGDHFRRYWQTFGAVGLPVFIPVVARSCASHVEGGIASLNYGYKLVELPFGLLGSVVTMAVFPKVSRLFQEPPGEKLKQLLSLSTSSILVATVPLLVFVLGAAEPLVALLFQRGGLGFAEVSQIAALTRIAFVALPAMVLATFVTSIFHAIGDTRTPFVISIASGVLLVSVCVPFVLPLTSIAGVVTVVQIGHAASLLIALRFRGGIALQSSSAMLHGTACLVISGLLGAIAWGVGDGIQQWLPKLAIASAAGSLCLGCWSVALFANWKAATLPSSPVPHGSTAESRVEPRRLAA